jgi:hypothetical protein
MVRHIGEGLQQDGLHADIWCIIVGGLDIVAAVAKIAGVLCEGGREAGILFEAFEGDEDIDAANGGRVVAYRCEDAHFGDPQPVKGRKEGGLQIFIDPCFLVSIL